MATKKNQGTRKSLKYGLPFSIRGCGLSCSFAVSVNKLRTYACKGERRATFVDDLCLAAKPWFFLEIYANKCVFARP
jgi:hypothetical protein